MINCQWDFDELNHHLKADAKRYIAKNNISCTPSTPSTSPIEIGMGKRNNTILQSAFFSLAKVMPEEQAIQYMKDAATHSYLKKGQDIVDMNHKAIDLGATAYKKIDVPADWANAVDEDKAEVLKGKPELVKQVKDILDPIDRMDGDSLPGFRLHAARGRPVGAGRFRLREARQSPSPFPPGTRPSASSATTVPTSARTLPSVPSLSPRRRPRTLPPLPRSLTSRPVRARASISTPWPSPRSTAWAAASASASARVLGVVLEQGVAPRGTVAVLIRAVRGGSAGAAPDGRAAGGVGDVHTVAKELGDEARVARLC